VVDVAVVDVAAAAAEAVAVVATAAAAAAAATADGLEAGPVADGDAVQARPPQTAIARADPPALGKAATARQSLPVAGAAGMSDAAVEATPRPSEATRVWA
jgi:hypothetical protein